MRSMILGILLLTADVAHAETGDKGYFTLGLGAPSCGQFIAVIGNAPQGSTTLHTGCTCHGSGDLCRVTTPRSTACGCAIGATRTRRRWSPTVPLPSSTR